MKKPNEIAVTLVQEKTNPRISVRIGDRAAGLMLVTLYRNLLDKYLPDFLEALKKEGPVSKIAALSKNWGDKAYVQANIAEALALGKAKPMFAKVLKKFMAEIKKSESVPYKVDPNVKFKIYKIKLNSRLNPSAKADIAIYDVVDPKIGLVVEEMVEDVTGVAKKGIAAAQKIAGETQRAEWQPKLTTFKGKRGYWVTVGGGRKVFIEESKFKGYQRWTNNANAGKWATALGVTGIGLGMLPTALNLYELHKTKQLLDKSLRGKFLKMLGVGKLMEESYWKLGEKSLSELIDIHASELADKDAKKLIRRVIFEKIGKSTAKASALLAMAGAGIWALSNLALSFHLWKAPQKKD